MAPGVEAAAEVVDGKIIVFQYRPRCRAPQWLHFECVKETWREGKFHDPVIVPVADLDGARCVLCREAIVPAEGK